MDCFIFSLVRSAVSQYFFFFFFLSVICGSEISLSKISQFQNTAKIYHIEHKKPRYFHTGICFNTIATRILSKISPSIAIHRRSVYLFQHDNDRIPLWFFYFPFRCQIKRSKKIESNLVREIFYSLCIETRQISTIKINKKIIDSMNHKVHFG